MFIIDQNNHLIAADTADLEQWGFSDILDAVRAFREESLRFEKEVGILLLPDDNSLTCKVETLDSLLGAWYLCHPVREEAVEEAPTETTTPSTEPEEELMQLLPESQEEAQAEAAPSAITEEQTREAEAELEALLKLLPEEEEAPIEAAEEEAPLSLMTEEEEEVTPSVPAPEAKEELPIPEIPEEEEEMLQLLAEEPVEAAPAPEEEAPLTLREEEPAEEEAPLVLEEEEEAAPALEAAENEGPLIPLPEAEEKAWLKLEAAFKPDLQTNAVNLDLGTKEYTALVSDFVHDCRQMRGELLEGDATARREAASVLKDAVTLLQLSPIDRLLDMIESASPEERTEIVDTLDRMLGRLEQPEATSTGPSAVETAREAEKPTAAPEQAEMETPVAAEEKAETTPAVQPEVSTESFLKGVKPVPIEFSLQIAAEELNLPEDLVLEFINDFANQGHEYLPVLIDAYEKKDLDQLQKTAHMLKGAASNLRVEAMVENLYELQFDNDIERAPERIRKFAGQLMSLDNFLKQLNG